MTEIISICTYFLNCNGTIGKIIGEATQHTTGDLFLTFFWGMLFIFAIGLMFGIRIEYVFIITLPLMLGLMANIQGFFPIGGAIIIYLVIIATYNFIIR